MRGLTEHRRLESIHFTRQAGALEEGVALRVVATRWAGTRRNCRKHPMNGQRNRRRLAPPPRGRRPRPPSCRRAERDLLLCYQNWGTCYRLKGRLTVSSRDMGFWCCGHFGPPCGSDWLLMSCRRCPREWTAVRCAECGFMWICSPARYMTNPWSLSSGPRLSPLGAPNSPPNRKRLGTTVVSALIP